MKVSAKPTIEELMEFLTRDFEEDEKVGYRSLTRQLLPDCSDPEKVERQWQIEVLKGKIADRTFVYKHDTERDKEKLRSVRKKFQPTVKDGFWPYYLFPYQGPPYDHVFTAEDHRKMLNNVEYKRWAGILLRLLRENQ